MKILQECSNAITSLTALGAKDVTLVLKWIPQKDEGALKAAFEKTLKERAIAPEVKEKADMAFFEVLIGIIVKARACLLPA